MSPDRILLVEDDRRVRDELRAALSREGFEVLEAGGVGDDGSLVEHAALGRRR